MLYPYLRKRSLLFLTSLAFLAACKKEPLDYRVTTADVAKSSLVTAHAASLNTLAGMPNVSVVQTGFVQTLIGGPSQSILSGPNAIAADAARNYYVTDGNQVKKFNASGTLIATFGNGTAGWQDGPAASAEFNGPFGIAVGANGMVYVADAANNRIRTIAPGGTVATLAGNAKAGFNDGAGAIATFNNPTGIAVDANGQVYVADHNNNMIRRISPTGIVTHWCGQIAAGSQDGAGSAASFNGPIAITVAPNGIAYVADEFNNTIRKIYSGTVTTLAGAASNPPATVDGTGSNASFFVPTGITVDASGNLYVMQFANAVRFVTPAGNVTTLAGGGSAGFSNGYGSQASFVFPFGIVVDPSGEILIADQGNKAIRTVSIVPAVRTLAGDGQKGYQEGHGPAALFTFPESVATAPDGTIYVADAAPNNIRIRKITPDGTTSLFAGNNGTGYRDGSAAQALFGQSLKLAIGPDGTLYVSDASNNRIRKISGGVVSTLAGNGQPIDGEGIGTNAPIFYPEGITVDAQGMIYFGTTESGKLYRLTPAGQFTIIGQIPPAPPGSSLPYPPIFNVAIDTKGNRYVASLENIYQFTGDNQPPTAWYSNTPSAYFGPLV
jgi:sugar lactone lactonase YvrE